MPFGNQILYPSYCVHLNSPPLFPFLAELFQNPPGDAKLSVWRDGLRRIGLVVRDKHDLRADIPVAVGKICYDSIIRSLFFVNLDKAVAVVYEDPHFSSVQPVAALYPYQLSAVVERLHAVPADIDSEIGLVRDGVFWNFYIIESLFIQKGIVTGGCRDPADPLRHMLHWP